MDSMPKKFRLPPSKPPRRHQLSPTGILLSNKVKDTMKSPVSKEIVDISILKCESLLSSLTSEKIRKKSFPKSEKNNSKERITSMFSSDDVGQIKNDFKACDFELTKSNDCHSKLLKHQFRLDSILSVEHSRRSCNYFHFKPSKINISESNGDENYFDSIHALRFLHRRQNSDPLPSNSLNKNSISCSHKIYKACGPSESMFLLQEIKSLKEINHKLWEHLCCTQAILEKIMSNLNNPHDLPTAVSFSDLLLSLYNSLRAKDTAMENRMKLILLERDNAIQNLNSMVQTATRNFEDIYSKGKDISASEKGKSLENQLQNPTDIFEFDKICWERNLLTILCQTIQQRDTALQNYDACNLEYSNKKYDEEKSDITTPYEKNIELISVTDELRCLEEQLFVLNKSLEGKEMSKEKCLRFNKLLRKKLKGKTVGILV